MAENNTSVLAIERAFAVLETIAASGPCSVAELHKQLKISKPSLSRLLATLHQIGYLNRDEKTGNYSMTFKTYEVGLNAMRGFDYINTIKSSLSDLSARTGLIAQYSIEDKNELLCLETFNQSGSPFSIFSVCGRRSPLYSSSAGKAILSTYSNLEIAEKLKNVEFVQLTDTTITSIDALLKEISEVRFKNYAFDLAESEPGLYCIGSPIVNMNHNAIGAISLSAYYSSKEEMQRHSEVLLHCTARLSTLLGGIQI